MNIQIQEKLDQLFRKQNQLLESHWDLDQISDSQDAQLKTLIASEVHSLEPEARKRILDEIYGLGPLEVLLSDPTVTEILVNTPKTIIFERQGRLQLADDFFYNQTTYNQIIERLSQMCRGFMNQERPFIESQMGKLRITLIYSELARGSHLISIRKQPEQVWTLSQLKKNNWCTDQQLTLVQKMIIKRDNFIVVGGTSSGKTSALQALLGELQPLERVVMIEDTQELHPPNSVSTSLLTRTSTLEKLCNIDMNDLLKRALRLRPDRLVVGEIRGAEATNLLMALATGHDGSFGSMHARTAQEALLRLEMLIQMGAPQWSLESVRKLIAMTVKYILVVEKKEGLRRLEGLYQIMSVESSGLTLMKVDEEI